MGVTISTHNGSQVAYEHNVRNPKVVSKEEHIDLEGVHESWRDIKPREAYEKLFGGAVKRYNERQQREDRKIKNYYADVCKDAKKHPVYEMIIGVYPQEGQKLGKDMQKRILREFVDGWQTRNPNLFMCGAYYHADEEGQPHVHIDYIPVARGYTRGMDTQNGLVKALEQQGIVKQGRATAQIQWEKRENEHLEKLCQARGLVVDHPTRESQEHLHTGLYKAKKSIEETQAKLDKLEKDLLTRNQVMEVEHKPAAFNRNKVVLAADDFERLRRTAATAEALEAEFAPYKEDAEKIIEDAKKKSNKMLNKASIEVGMLYDDAVEKCEAKYEEYKFINEEVQKLEKKKYMLEEVLAQNQLDIIKKDLPHLFNAQGQYISKKKKIEKEEQSFEFRNNLDDYDLDL